jgi:predicted nucleotidyltransferase
MVRKITGIDDLVKSVVDRLGNLEAAYLIGEYARGADTGIIDVVLVGEVDRVQLDDFVAKTEAYIERKIRTLVVSSEEFQRLQSTKGFKPILKLWESGNALAGTRRIP